jgi:TonB family protein
MSNTWREWEGQIVDGRFTLLRHLGGSDHSVVFETQRGTDQPQKAAIKFLHADDKASAQLAIWEQTAQISHASLLKVFESGRCQLAGMDLLYVVVECVEENLAQFLPDNALSTAETRQMLEPLLDALACLHGKGFVHSRIRPGNIMAIGDQLKLSSDSLCRIGERRGVTKNLDIYAPPEAANEMSLRTGAGDVWSLGITLVEALTQQPPQITEGADPIVPDSVPDPFGDIARSSLRREPKTRASVADILAKLNPAAVPVAPPAPVIRDVAATSEKPPTPVPAPASKHPSLDPLSVSLSPVPPPAIAKRQPVEPPRKNLPPRVPPHTIPRVGTSRKSYYLVVAVLLAVTVAAAVAIPRLRNLTAGDTDASNTGVSAANGAAAQLGPVVSPNASQLHSKGKQKQVPPAAELASQRSNSSPSGSQPGVVQNMSNNVPVGHDAAPATPDSAAASAQPVAAPVRAGSVRETLDPSAGVAPGEVLNEVIPEVSERSKETIHGTVKVTLKAHVDESGAVTNLVPASRSSKFFTEAAIQAARRWDFSPAKVDGHAVPSEWLLRFEFTQAEAKVYPSQLTP